jgi:CRISPR-associated protein Cmr3
MNEFKYAIVIKPLGLLYGSAGPFLSPDNLVGRSGNHFPPNTATLSGLYVSPRATSQTAEEKESDQEFLNSLMFAGPFWGMTDNPLNFHVPLPLTCETDPEKDKVIQIWDWQPANEDGERGYWYRPDGLKKKRDDRKTWIAINDWEKLQNWKPAWADFTIESENLSLADRKKLFEKRSTTEGHPLNITVKTEPWQPAPHLHPRLELDQRRVAQNLDRGSLFLENAVQMHPDTCLVYLASHELPEGWYRFGGEGHMVEIESVPLTPKLLDLIDRPVGDRFALVAPAAWGTKNFSYRFPVDHLQDPQPIWSIRDMMTERAQPHRFLTKSLKHDPRFSRGRYVVPARTVYVLDEQTPIDRPWRKWPLEWFPTEGGSYQRWGSGFALPL